MVESADDPFRGFLSELADGQRWALIRTKGWEEFAERLAKAIAELPPRRRQALVMLLFALSERMLTPEEAEQWLGTHDVDTEEGVEAMISWLRSRRTG